MVLNVQCLLSLYFFYLILLNMHFIYLVWLYTVVLKQGSMQAIRIHSSLCVLSSISLSMSSFLDNVFVFWHLIRCLMLHDRKLYMLNSDF